MRHRALLLLGAIALSSSTASPAAAAQADQPSFGGLPFEQLLTVAESGPVAPAMIEADSFPDPAVDLPVEAWFGCRPPYGGVCVTDPRVADPFIGLIPVDSATAEDWRSLVEQFFLPGHVDKAIRVIGCESGGDPSAKNPRSTASGLFQHLGSLWEPRVASAGYPGADIFDPVANVAAAAWLVYDGGGWGHWNPSRHCWR